MTARDLQELLSEIEPLDYLRVCGPDAAPVTDETAITFDASLTIGQLRKIVVAADQGFRRAEGQFAGDAARFKETTLRDVASVFDSGFPKIEVTVEPEYQERYSGGPLKEPVMLVIGRKVVVHGYGPKP